MLRVGDIVTDGKSKYLLVGYDKESFKNYVNLMIKDIDTVLENDMSYMTPEIMYSYMEIMRSSFIASSFDEFAKNCGIFCTYDNGIFYSPVRLRQNIRVISHLNFNLTTALLGADEIARETLLSWDEALMTEEECISYSKETDLYRKHEIVMSLKESRYKTYEEYIKKHLKKTNDLQQVNVLHKGKWWIAGAYCNNTFYVDSISETLVDMYTGLIECFDGCFEQDVNGAEWYYLDY